MKLYFNPILQQVSKEARMFYHLVLQRSIALQGGWHVLMSSTFSSWEKENLISLVQ